MGADLQPPGLPDLPEWAAKALGATGIAGLVTGVVAFTAKIVDRFVPSADRRSRERVDMLEQANRRIRELETANRALAKHLEEEQTASDGYRDEYFAAQREGVQLVQRAVKAELELDLMRTRLEQRGEGVAPPTAPEDLAAMRESADRHRAQKREQAQQEGDTP